MKIDWNKGARRHRAVHAFVGGDADQSVNQSDNRNAAVSMPSLDSIEEARVLLEKRSGQPVSLAEAQRTLEEVIGIFAIILAWGEHGKKPPKATAEKSSKHESA